jgi:hypothetical protein
MPRIDKYGYVRRRVDGFSRKWFTPHYLQVGRNKTILAIHLSYIQIPEEYKNKRICLRVEIMDTPENKEKYDDDNEQQKIDDETIEEEQE